MEEEEVPGAVEEDEEASVLAAAVYHIMSATDSLLDNEESLVEHGGIPSLSEDLPTSSDILTSTTTPYIVAFPASPAACASASHVPQDLVSTSVSPNLLVFALMIGPSWHRTAGRPVDLNGEGLIAPWTHRKH